MTVVEIRCPVNTSRLFLKLHDARIVEGNLIEVACRDCRTEERLRNPAVRLVLHRFDVLGVLIETDVQYDGVS